jgi:hypothetical protein
VARAVTGASHSRSECCRRVRLGPATVWLAGPRFVPPRRRLDCRLEFADAWALFDSTSLAGPVEPTVAGYGAGCGCWGAGRRSVICGFVTVPRAGARARLEWRPPSGCQRGVDLAG